MYKGGGLKMSKEIKKTLSNRIIVSNTHTNQFYCRRYLCIFR